MKQAEYDTELVKRIGRVFRSHPEIPDHRDALPWVTAFLGDPFAGIWFVAENPSLGMASRRRGLLTTEDQWTISPGDRLLRRMLVKYGFKNGAADAPGGWRCYVTDIIKSGVHAEKWNREAREKHLQVAEAWAGVFAWELRTGQPRLVVVMGRRTQEMLTHLTRRGLLRLLPPTVQIDHYAYIGQRADARHSLPPMHRTRVFEFDRQFTMVARACRDAVSRSSGRPPGWWLRKSTGGRAGATDADQKR